MTKKENHGMGEGLLMEIIDQLPHAITWKDRNHVYLGANRYFIKYFGMGRPENIIGRTPHDLYSDRQQLDLVLDTDRRVLSTGEPVLNYERHFLTQDGQERTTLNSKFPLRDEGGNIIGVLAVGNDITELKNLESVLQESVRRYQESVENASSPVFSVDRAGTIQMWNRACAEVFGYGKEIIGQLFTRLLWNAEDGDDIFGCIAGVFQERTFGNMEISFKTRWSERVICVSRLYPLFRGKGEVEACVFASSNITEWRKAEDRMKHRLNIERMVSTISSRFVGVYDIDRAIVATLRDLGRFSRAGRSYLFRIREDGEYMDNTHEWCGEGVSAQKDRLQNLPLSMFPWWMNKLYTESYIHIGELSHLPPEAAAEREILESQDIKSALVIGFSVEGRVAGFIGFDNVLGDVEWDEGDLALLRTVSEIIGNAFERNLAEEKLRSSLAEKEILLREVHHRVKNNLQVVSSLLDLSMLHSDNAHTRRILEDARSKVNTMALIHTHLYRDAELDRINIAKCLENLVEQLSCIYSSSGSVDTVIQSSDVLLDINQAIPCALVLNELVSNAFKHAFMDRRGGTIEIAIGEERTDEVSVLLRDNGIGMPEGLDLDTAGSLGLTLVNNLVKNQLKGRVTMRRDGGTEYSIRFKKKSIDPSQSVPRILI
jgi:PAS domain S-box-containing protein